MDNRLKLAVRRNKGLKLKSYFINLLNDSGIPFEDENLIGLFQTDEIDKMINTSFAWKVNHDELLIIEKSQLHLVVPIFERIKSQFLESKGYLKTDVYEFCGIYQENFALLLDKFCSLILNSEDNTCMLLDDKYNIHITGNLINQEDAEKSTHILEIQIKFNTRK